MKPRLLIIRFSSFGDIVQALAVQQAFMQKYPEAEIHWVVRKDFADLLSFSPYVHKVWAFDKKEGLAGLLRLAKTLNAIKWSHVYDAHNNVRSQILTKIIKSQFFARRSKERVKRFLEFKLRIRQFKTRYIGQLSYLKPLEKWGISAQISASPPLTASESSVQEIYKRFGLKNPYVTLMPSAAWVMKRWPISHWKSLIAKLNTQNIVLLGGPEDYFISDLAGSANVINLSGQLSLLESGYVIAGSSLVVSADTGVLHLADQLGVPAIALIGPSAFGYPGRSTSEVAEVELSCKPCSKDGRGKCINKIYQKCMIDITPERIEKMISNLGAKR